MNTARSGPLQKLYVLLILVFMYAPIVTLMVLSFNASKSRSRWGGFSLKWYTQLFSNSAIMNAFSNTMMVALLSASIAVIFGTAACVGMQFMKRRYRSAIMGITNIPMLNADIVTGLSLMLLFIAARFSMGFTSVLLAHITFNIPYCILAIIPRFRILNKNVYEAALDLGATPVQAFIKVIIPELMPGIVSGWVMSFTMSLDDFIITHFTKGIGFDTLSTRIYAEVKKGINPSIYALSTIMFTVVLLLLFMVNVSGREKSRKNNK